MWWIKISIFVSVQYHYYECKSKKYFLLLDMILSYHIISRYDIIISSRISCCFILYSLSETTLEMKYSDFKKCFIANFSYFEWRNFLSQILSTCVIITWWHHVLNTCDLYYRELTALRHTNNGHYEKPSWFQRCMSWSLYVSVIDGKFRLKNI